MTKWKIAIPIIVFLVIAIFFLTTAFTKGFLGQSPDKVLADSTTCNNIGTNVGPGEGSLSFEINSGKTKVEAVSVLNKMPQKGDSLTAIFCLNEKIGGEVQNIVAVWQNRAIVTILTMKGLITVGVLIVP